jgi:Tfp pilus assembly protein PilV
VYDAKYGPSYRVSFFITLGIAIVSLLGYISYRFTLAAVNRRKRRILSQMTPEEIASERIDNTRYADRKRTFIYGL